jgi:hypothetical protein
VQNKQPKGLGMVVEAQVQKYHSTLEQPRQKNYITFENVKNFKNHFSKKIK